MAEKLMLIDGNSIMNRAFYGIPDLTNAKGFHTNAIYGFLNIMFKFLEEENPSYLAVAFDLKAPTFRHQMYDAYKGTRKPMPQELRQQFPVIKEMLKAMGILIMEQEGYEADDILGTMAKRAEKEGLLVSLISGDRDLLQIATDNIKIRIPKTKGNKTEVEDYLAKDVKERYHVTPLQFIELKALMGDTSDNIPGVPKVGEKTATNLMETYGSIDGIYEHLDEISKKSIQTTLRENRDLADLSFKLAQIEIDAPVPYTYQMAKIENIYTRKAYEMCIELEFKNMLSRFQKKESYNIKAEKIDVAVIEDLSICEEVFEKCRSGGVTVVHPFDECGIGLAHEGSFWFIHEQGFITRQYLSGKLQEVYEYLMSQRSFENDNKDDILSMIQKTTTDCIGQNVCNDDTNNQQGNNSNYAHDEVKNGLIAGFDVKKLYPYFELSPYAEKVGINAAGVFTDVKLLSYMLNPLKSEYMLEDVAHEYADISISDYKTLFGKTTYEEAFNFQQEEFIKYIGQILSSIMKSAPVLLQKIADEKMEVLYRKVELPLTYVLYSMERSGVSVRGEKLKEYSDMLSLRIEQLEKQIYEKAGETFNINSPKQLGEILFVKMQLKGGKKTKTGYSTAADVLEKLAADNPIIADILEYRTLAKLKSTYAEGLFDCIEKDGRIHTNFNQMITATGRISSTNPNLQNIPMRMEIGRQIRKVFVPEGNMLFMDADYSQIELRILAHMSQDKELIEAYQMAEDIHRMTASKVFHTPFDEVTDLQRRNAKAVNFGIVYGISSFGLSQDLSITRKEAAAYIEQYFETYPKIKEFLDQEIAYAKEHKECRTLYGRKRPVPELASSNFMQRQFGERVAMNAPIQGTAADIMKIAMNRVFYSMAKEKLKSRVILQVHDELLIEVDPDEEEIVRKILTDGMKHAANLAVELEIDVHTGSDWYEAK